MKEEFVPSPRASSLKDANRDMLSAVRVSIPDVLPPVRYLMGVNETLLAYIDLLEERVARLEKLHHMDEGGDVPSSVKHTHWDHKQWWDLVQEGVPSDVAAAMAGSA